MAASFNDVIDKYGNTGIVQPEYSKLVYLNTADPATATIFSESLPATVNDPALKSNDSYLYVGSDNKTWIFDPATNSYKSYTSPAATEWYYQNTTTDAGADKVNTIWRTGNIGVGGYALSDANLTMYQNATSKGITLTGTPVSFPKTGNGARWTLGTNLSGNIQHWFGDYDGLTGATVNTGYAFVRFIHVKNQIAIVDAMGPGYVIQNIKIGQANVAIGGSSVSQPLYNGHVYGTFGIDTLPSYTTATDILVKNPTTQQIGVRTLSSVISAGVSASSTLTAIAPNSTQNTGSVTINGTATTFKETVTSMFVNSALLTGPTVAQYYNESGSLTTIPGTDALTTAQAVPASTGNTTNLNTVFKATDGNAYFVDADGNSVQLGSAPPAQTANFIVYVNSTSPATATIFDENNNPPTTNNNAMKNRDDAIYVGTDGSTWTSNGTTYATWTPPASTEWNLSGTTTDAGSNKTGAIVRSGDIGVGVTTTSATAHFAQASNSGIPTTAATNLSIKPLMRLDGGLGRLGFYNNAASPFGFGFQAFDSVGGALPFTAQTTGGNFGIGSNLSPAYKLDVTGDARITVAPTITTATKMLVRDPVTNQISEQVIPTTSTITTTSLTPIYQNAGTKINAQASLDTSLADLLRLSDGTAINTGKVTWTGHGLTVGSWYYTSQSTAGAYVTPAPTSGFVQQLFFVEDANTIHVNIEQAVQVINAATSSPVVVQARFGAKTITTTPTDITGYAYTTVQSFPNSFDLTTGRFTAPVSGFYRISAKLTSAANWTANQYVQINLVSTSGGIGVCPNRTQAAGSFFMNNYGEGYTYLTAGQQLWLNVVAGQTATTASNEFFNELYIQKVN